MEKLKRLREERGLSQVKLAARADLNPATVNQIERGMRNASPGTLHKLADALEVSLYELLENDSPKAGRRSSPEPSLFNGLEVERHLRYLRAWRAFVYGLVHRWEEEPPTTSAELSPLFDTMTALVEQGVFDRSDVNNASEQMDLVLIMHGFQKLNDIADRVEKDEEAEQRRAKFTLIRESLGA